jgi:hypothetical protein
MSFSRQQYEKAAEQFFRQHPKSFEKYFSPTLLQTLVGAMQSSLPTATAAKIAFDRLVANGTLQRTDGRTDADDRAEAVAAAQANLNQVVAEVDSNPLSRSELEHFSGLSQRELSRLYFGEEGDAINEFAVRYRKANREHGFVLPPRFKDEVSSDSAEIGLTASAYKAMSARDLLVKLRNPAFKFQVMQLIKLGQIVLLVICASAGRGLI